MSDLKTRFDEAVNHIQTAEGDFKPSNEMKLEFYALYKQATAGDVSGVILVWKACRSMLDRGDGVEATVDDHKPMSAKTQESLQSKWTYHHHSSFTAIHVVSFVLMNKLWKHATATPKQFVIIMPEDIKLRAAVSKSDGDLLKIKKNVIMSVIIRPY